MQSTYSTKNNAKINYIVITQILLCNNVHILLVHLHLHEEVCIYFYCAHATTQQHGSHCIHLIYIYTPHALFLYMHELVLQKQKNRCTLSFIIILTVFFFCFCFIYLHLSLFVFVNVPLFPPVVAFALLLRPDPILPLCTECETQKSDMKSLNNQLLPLKAGDRNALSYGAFIHKKQTVNPHAGWGFSEGRGGQQCVRGVGSISRSVGRFIHTLYADVRPNDLCCR